MVKWLPAIALLFLVACAPISATSETVAATKLVQEQSVPEQVEPVDVEALELRIAELEEKIASLELDFIRLRLIHNDGDLTERIQALETDVKQVKERPLYAERAIGGSAASRQRHCIDGGTTTFDPIFVTHC